jgi:hypothetical protein
VLAYTPSAGDQWDSVALGRDLQRSVVATLGATYFRSPHFGYSLEAGFFGIDTRSRCRPLGPYYPTGDQQNAQACSYLQGRVIRGDAVGLLGGFVWRVKSRGFQPFVRAAVGPAVLGASYVEEAAPVLVNGAPTTIYFLADQNHPELTWMVSLGVGAMVPLSPGYQLHVELRNLIVALPRPTAAATDTGEIAADQVLPQPPIGMRVMQLPTLTVGLDVVLERKRGHRY